MFSDVVIKNVQLLSNTKICSLEILFFLKISLSKKHLIFPHRCYKNQLEEMGNILYNFNVYFIIRFSYLFFKKKWISWPQKMEKAES